MRLELRQIELSDAPEIFVLRSNEEVLRYLDRPKAVDMEDAINHIDKLTDLFDKGEGISWAISEIGGTELIGTVCLWNLQPNTGIVELGYSLHPSHWDRGIATEAVNAVIEFAFGTMKAVLIEAFVHPKNLASIKLLENQGFIMTGMEVGHNRYSLLAPPYGKILLETERIRLRELTPQDAPFLFELLNTPDWLKNIGDRKVKNISDAQKYLVYRLVLTCRLKGFGFYGISLRNGQLVGICGLVKRDFLEDIDIGYALLPMHYGNGYAYEAAIGLMDFAAKYLKLTKLAAITIDSNLSSIKLLGKLGFRFERNISIPDDQEVLMLFEKAIGGHV